MNISHKVIAIASAALITVSAAGGVALARGPFNFMNGLSVIEQGKAAGTVICVDREGNHILDGSTPRTHLQPTSYAGHSAMAVVLACP